MAIFAGYGNMIALRGADELVIHKSQDPRVVILEYACMALCLPGPGLQQSLHLRNFDRRSENRSLARLHGLLRCHGSANRNAKLKARMPCKEGIRTVGRI